MVFRLRTGFSLILLGVFAAFGTGTLASADPGKTYVTKLVQDEPRILPEENAAFFTRNDRRIRFQLMQWGDSPASLLAGTSVTVVTPEGQSNKLTADARGVATLSDVTPGLHAIVVAGEQGHVAMPLAIRERVEDALPELDELAPRAAVDTVRLPLIGVDPQEVMRVANSFLPAPTSLVSFADFDNRFIASGEIAQTYRNRVRLGPSGRLEGRVFSVLRPDLVTQSVAGTNVMIYSDNQLVARAIADEQGRFMVQNLLPGTHGLIAAGAGGYAAFAFEAIQTSAIVENAAEETLVSSLGERGTLVRINQPLTGGDMLPVLLVPQPMVPMLMDAIREGSLVPAADADLAVGLGGLAPVAGGGFAGGGMMGGGPGGGFGGGAGGGGIGGIGGIGGLLGLAGLAVGIAALADDDDRPIVFPTPPVATPAIPGP